MCSECLDTMDCGKKGRKYEQIYGSTMDKFHNKDSGENIYAFQNRIMFGIAIAELVHCLTYTCTNITPDYHRP